MHELRNDMSYRAIVDKIIDVPEGADTRDTEAVKRIATAYLKLLFPNVRTVSDIKPRDFNRYCLKRAIKMRAIILSQLAIIDTEYRGKSMPEFTLNGDV
ncbi:MAG: ATP-dependent protease, partial [Clostridia bacterium]|nr:ATP-dependent protease [Clostridia bacterium]